MYTREDWLLSFLDKSGTYLPDRLEGDKHAIEMYYQSNGYMNAKVASITPQMDACKISIFFLRSKKVIYIPLTPLATGQ